MPFSRLIKAAFGLVALAAMSTAAIAQTAPAWPQKPIKVIVNFGPGGSADNSMRPFAEKVSRGLGQQVVIENKGGASGALGLEAAARSAPDGYTFVVIPSARTTDSLIGCRALGTSLISRAAATPTLRAYQSPKRATGITPALSVVILPHLRKLPFDIFKDLAPVTQFTGGTLLFAVHPSVPANNLRDFVTYAKANPGKLSWGTAGVGSHGHVTAEYFKLITGTDILHVPYRGGGEALADFLAGVVQVHADPNTLPSVSAGKAKLLGVIDAERHPNFPDVPMVKEVYPEIDYVAWFGMLAPAGTPKPIIDRMAAEMNKVAREPDMKSFLLRFALRPNPGTPEQMATLLRNDYDRYGKLIKQINMKAE